MSLATRALVARHLATDQGNAPPFSGLSPLSARGGAGTGGATAAAKAGKGGKPCRRGKPGLGPRDQAAHMPMVQNVKDACLI